MAPTGRRSMRRAAPHDLSAMQVYLHQNSGAVGAANISFINHYSHDIQTKNTPTLPPWLLADGEDGSGLLIDRSKFERCAIEPILFDDPFTLHELHDPELDDRLQHRRSGQLAAALYDQITAGSRKTIDNRRQHDTTS